MTSRVRLRANLYGHHLCWIKIEQCAPEKNIVSYFEHVDGLDDSLIEFINRTDVDLNFSKNINIDNESFKGKLFKSIVICNDLSNDKYEKLICSLNIICKHPLALSNIASDKFKILVDKNIIRMNVCF